MLSRYSSYLPPVLISRMLTHCGLEKGDVNGGLALADGFKAVVVMERLKGKAREIVLRDKDVAKSKAYFLSVPWLYSAELRKSGLSNQS